MPDWRLVLDEGRKYQKAGMLDRALDLYGQVVASGAPPPLLAEGLCRQASVYRAKCEWDNALEAARRSEEVARTADLREQYEEALNAQAAVFQTRGDFDTATPIFEHLLTYSTNDRIRGIAMQNLGAIAAQRGDFELATRRFLESHACFKRAEYRRGEAIALNNMAAAALDQGDLELADSAAERALGVSRQLGDLELIGLATLNSAEVHTRRDELALAEDLASTALGYFTNAQNTLRQVEALRLLGDINCKQGNADAAARCYERGLSLAREISALVEVSEIEACLRKLPSNQ